MEASLFSGCPDMSPPPNLLIRGGASRLAKEHASQSVFIQRMGRCVAVWREWQRVHTIGHSANRPSLAPFVTRKERVRGWYSSERLEGGVSCACVGHRTRQTVCVVYTSGQGRSKPSAEVQALVGHCAFFVSLLRPARCSAIGACCVIPGVLNAVT